MKVVIDIPNDFTGDYIVDKFKDFFSRVIADIDCKGARGRYEKEIAEMFLKAFNDSEEKISCDCRHRDNSRGNEPCCRCDSRKTNADRIRNMSDEELGDFLQSVSSGAGNGSPFISLCVDDNEMTMNFSDIYEWLQSEAE